MLQMGIRGINKRSASQSNSVELGASPRLVRSSKKKPLEENFKGLLVAEAGLEPTTFGL